MLTSFLVNNVHKPTCIRHQRVSTLLCRVVVLAMVISLGGVVMIAQPAFIFGGQGLNKLGLAFGLMQVGF